MPLYDEDLNEDRAIEKNDVVENDDNYSTSSDEPLAVDMSDPQIREVFVEAKREPARQGGLTNEIAGALSAGEPLHPSTASGLMLGQSIAEKFRQGGHEAVNKLVKGINEHLPDGMQLVQSQDPKLQEQVRQDFKNKNLPIPDYIAAFELKSKDGKALGNIVFSGDSKQMAKENEARSEYTDALAKALGKENLKTNSETGQLLGGGILSIFNSYGKGGVEQLIADINSKMPADRSLDIVNDPALTKQLQDQYRAQGLRPPEYIRTFQLKDKEGNGLGGIRMVIGGDPPPRPAPKKQEPPTIFT